MSESIPPSEQPETTPAGEAGKRTGLVRLVPRGKRARWVVLGAAAVIVGGGALGAAVAAGDHHERKDRGPHVAWSGPGDQGPGHKGPGHKGHGPEDGGPEGPGERPGPKQGGPNMKDRRGAAGRGDVVRKAPAAPAPLPSLAIGQAAEKAAGAVPGGKVEGLRAVAQQGGGSAWLAVVLGPDGVRHAVTVSGTDGAITGNVTLDRG